MEYGGESRKDKLAALRKDVAELGADTFVLTSLDDLCWLLNIRGDDVACCRWYWVTSSLRGMR